MKPVLKISLAANILLLALLCWVIFREKYPQRTYNALTATNKKETGRMTYSFNRDQLFEALPKDSNAIIFLGNSLTCNFELAELFHNADIKNRGINGDITPGVLQRLKPIVACRPKKIFIEIGINDILMKLDQDSILKNYIAILETFKAQCPRSKVYIQGILPVSTANLSSAGFDQGKLNEEIRSVNARLSAYAAENQVVYIDLYTRFALNNGINPAYSTDGVHLSGAGYLLWASVLKPYMEINSAGK